jgi:hypothetical protein
LHGQLDAGGGTTSWHTGSNWDTNVVPGAGDNVCIGASFTVDFTSGTTSIQTLQSAGTLNISGGTLMLTDAVNPATAKTLGLAGGTLNGAGSLNVSGTLIWNRRRIALSDHHDQAER